MSCSVETSWGIALLIIGLIIVVVTSIYLSKKNSTEETFDYKSWESWLWFFLLIGVVLIILSIGLFVSSAYPGSCNISTGSKPPSYTAVPGTTGTLGLPYTPGVGSMVQTSI
jgi:uncharacterized membrane protein